MAYKKLNCYETPLPPIFDARKVDVRIPRSPNINAKDGSGAREWPHWERGMGPPIADTSIPDSSDAKGGLAPRKGNTLMGRVRHVVRGGFEYPPSQVDVSCSIPHMNVKYGPGPLTNNIVNTSDPNSAFKSYLNAPRKKVVV